VALSEFEIIDRYFRSRAPRRRDVIVGIGDDGAVLSVPEGQHLVVSMDTLVCDVHFPASAPARAVGHKALAVNLSDLAAMGAEPAWATLALTLPEADEAWLRGFAEGFFALAESFEVDLVGGDTTRGPLSVTVQVHGFVPPGGAMCRRGARPGDGIFVTGTLGDAALALWLLQKRRRGGVRERAYLLSRLHTPLPRVSVGLALREYASAAIDLSDGLIGDLGHVCRSSGVGASLWVDKLPRSDAFAALADEEEGYRLALVGGDDYELCLTVPPEHQSALKQAAGSLDCRLTRIGIVERESALRCLHDDGTELRIRGGAWQHFRRESDG